MNLLLAIETSWHDHRLVLGETSSNLVDSRYDIAAHNSLDLSEQVATCLDRLHAEVLDIRAIAVNVGPGGLSAIRTGIAFSNALAFSLSIPIFPFNYFEIVAREACLITDLPTIVSVPSAGDHASIGLVGDGRVQSARFGSLAPTVNATRAGLRSVAIAGRKRQQMLPFLGDATVLDTGIDAPDCRVLFNMGITAWQQSAPTVSQAEPLTEESHLFS